jgi:Arc/MetJ-type ribon-helix-helix transcriptional regulator
VIRLSQNQDKWTTVRVPVEILRAIDEFMKTQIDEFGLPKFRSKSDVVTEAIKEFLKKHREVCCGA